MTYSFIVLHYKEGSIGDTFKCVDSITNIDNTNNIRVIIVENGSKDNSFQMLRAKYGDVSFISIIKNKENLGFARGNNAGYDYTLKYHKPRFIVFLNNDTVIKQSNVLSLINEEFMNSEFYILGPKIVNKGSLFNHYKLSHDNLTLDKIEENIKNKEKLLAEHEKKISLYLFKLSFFKFFKTMYRFLKVHFMRVLRLQNYNNYNNNLRYENVKLRGSAIIFSYLYTNEYEYAFYPDTFLYNEEDILFYIAKRDNLKMVYNPNIVVHHTEDTSTNLIAKGKHKKIFFLRHSINSLKVFKNLVQEDNSKNE